MRTAVFGLGVATLGVTGCIHARDFQEPTSRITENSAYTEVRPVRLDFGVVGRNTYELGANLGVRGAVVPGRFELGTNLAHTALGAPNLQARFTFLERPHYALGGRLAFRYINSQALWVLPQDIRRDFGKIHLASAPIEVVNSFPLARWITINAAVGYRHAEVWGEYRGSGLVVEGAVAARQLYLEPYFNFYAGRRVAIIAGAHLPVWAQGLSNAIAHVEVVDGVRIGVQSAEWVRLRFQTLVSAELAVEARLGKHTNMRLSLIQGVLAKYPLPALGMYWRFGKPRRARGPAPSSTPPPQEAGDD